MPPNLQLFKEKPRPVTETKVESRQRPAGNPPLLEAIDVTLRVMERRIRWYRNLIVFGSLTSFGSLVFVFVFQRWIGLISLLAFPASVGVFLFLDAHVVRTWRSQIQKLINQGGLSIEQLERTLTAFRYIPPATLRSMMASLSVLKMNLTDLVSPTIWLSY